MPRDATARRLVEIEDFGSNPGSLRCHLFLPTILPPKAPLAVVLHGCTQTAAGYDYGAGWSQVAEDRGFAVLFPEQRRENNANLCFNWFEHVDTQRDSGEALSIREMIRHVVLSQGLDPERVFISGLSAGGAMANVMLATYPEVFAAGAIIGGLPYGMANSVGQAFERMKGRNPPSQRALKSALKNAAPEPTRKPRVSVWHGTHDQVVRPTNTEQIALQWIDDGRQIGSPDEVMTITGHTRRTWLARDGGSDVEVYLIRGMGHGVPLASGAEVPIGKPGPFMLESGISSTARISRGWDLVDDTYVASAEAFGKSTTGRTSTEGAETENATSMRFARAMTSRPSSVASTGKAIGDVINDALRAAGLLR